LEDDLFVQLEREEADAEADLALGVVLIVLVKHRVVKVAVLNPEVFVSRRAFDVFGVNAGHAVAEFDTENLVAALVVEADAAPILPKVLAINEGLFPFAVSADEDGLLWGATAFGREFLIPSVALFEEDTIARLLITRGFREGFPRGGGVSAIVGIVTSRLTDVNRFSFGGSGE